MSTDLDALIIRSLPELNDAAKRLQSLNGEIGQAIDAEIEAWIVRNDWKGQGARNGEGPSTWLGLQSWFVPGDPDNTGHLYFWFGPNSEDLDTVRLVGAGTEQLGFCLSYDIIKDGQFKKLWRTFLAANPGLPVNEAGMFFISVQLDRETLAEAVGSGSLDTAFEPLRKALDSLPQYASRLEPLKRQIVAASIDKGKTGPVS